MQFQYGIDSRVPFLKSVLFGLQWAAILISSIVILGKVIGVLHFDDPLCRIVYLQKLLFLSAGTLVCQVFWGHRLPVVPGPATVLLIGVMASQGFGMPAVYTSVMIGGAFIAVLAITGLFGHVQKLFTANVVAVVLLLIAFTLAPAIMGMIIGQGSGVDPFLNVCFAFALLFLMFGCYRLLQGIWKSTLMIWAMVAASIVYFFVFPAAQLDRLFLKAPWFSGFFQQMIVDPSIQPGVLMSFIFCFLALSVNDLGSMQAVGELLEAGDMTGRIKRGVLLTGLANVASGFLGVIGPVNYSLSPGVIASTGCASRFTLLPAAVVMGALAFFPAATGFIGSVPSVVIGAVLAYIMASQVAAGLAIAFSGEKGAGFTFENGLVIGLSVLLGNMVAFFPSHAINAMPPFLRPILGNGFVVGVACALILERVLATGNHDGIN
ncbi:MAG: purine/pyrimidine permease [Deltaproteobacteria bacterium]|nr:purine/pyrimidine permease [Deltaproteobacteria bacterium]